MKKQTKKKAKKCVKKKVNKKQKEEMFLQLKIKKPMQKIIEEYCSAVGQSPQDVGYHLGYILSVREDLATPLTVLNQTHFFAGMFFALTQKQNYSQELIPLSEKDKMLQEIEETLRGKPGDIKDHSYVG